MKIKSGEEYTKMVGGSVQRQFKKCGKSNCKCARGELHGAYYYHFVRVGGKLIRRYFKASEVEQTRQACLSRRTKQKAEQINSNKAWQQLREIRESLRSVTDLYNR